MMRQTGIFVVFLLAAAPLAQGQVEPPSRAQWEVVRSVTPEGLTKAEALVLRGTSPVPFYAPRPEHFRLERLGPEPVWEVMTFGWPDRGHVEFDHPEDATTGEVNLHLRRLRGGKQTLQTAMQLARDQRDPPPVNLRAESALQQGVRYRLSWSFRLAGSDTVQTKRCEFQIGKASANPRSAIGATRKIPEQPYLVEILFRDDNGSLFLGQTVLPKPEDNDFTLAAVGFTSDGRHVPPPDPGYVTEQVQLAHVTMKPLAPKRPPAERTHLFHASIERAYAPPGQVAVSISDMGTSGPLPKTSGEPTFTAFSNGLYDAVFRVELLTTNVEILRQDLNHWRKRTRTIAAELLERRAWMKEDTHRLATVTRVLQSVPGPPGASSEVVNGLRIDLTAAVMPDGQPKLRMQFTNAAWDPFDIVACPLFLEVQDTQGHWRAFQHPRWGGDKHEGPETLKLGASISETEPVSAFTSLPPGKHRVRVSIAIDKGMASKYESARVWTGVARSNCVVIEMPPQDSETK